jgi:hypothetical protein
MVLLHRHRKVKKTARATPPQDTLTRHFAKKPMNFKSKPMILK